MSASHDHPTPPGLRRGFRPSLTQLILVGLALGVLVGWLWPSFAASLRPIATLFLRLIKMIVSPLILSTLVASIAGAGGKAAGRMGIKAIVWFEVATTVALLVGLVAVNLVAPGTGVTLAAGTGGLSTLAHEKGTVQFLVETVPTSIFDALARNDVLQVVVFSVFIGLGVSAAGERAAPVKKLAEATADVLFKVVGAVMKFAPLGVSAAMAAALGHNGMGVLWPLLKAVGTLYGALAVFLALLLVGTWLITGVRLRTFVSAIREPALIAFTTTSSEAAMPRAMQILEKLGVPRDVVAFVIPTGYSFNLDGSTLYLSVTLLFIAQASGVHMSVTEQLTAMGLLMLTSKGVAGVPRSALVVLSGAVTAFHLPLEGVALLLGIDEIMDMGRTTVNVVGNCAAAVVVARWEHVLPADAAIYGPRAPALEEAAT
jgi:proton glutamate symport protein